MHIPDGVLDTGTLAATGVASAGAVAWSAVALRRGRQRLGLALAGGAVVLAGHLVDVTLIGGHTAHLMGGALLAIALGPSLAVVTMAAVLALEALAWGDGGIAALGANVMVMAVVGVLAGWGTYRAIHRIHARAGARRPSRMNSVRTAAPTPAGRPLAAAVAGFASVVASTGALAAVEAVGAPGGFAAAALVPHHLAWAALEGALTGAIVAVAVGVASAVAARRARAVAARG